MDSRQGTERVSFLKDNVVTINADMRDGSSAIQVFDTQYEYKRGIGMGLGTSGDRAMEAGLDGFLRRRLRRRCSSKTRGSSDEKGK